MKFKELSKEIVRENMDLVHDQCTWGVYQEALNWYPTARSYAEEFSKEYGVDLIVVAGLISVLSPQKSWFQNLILTKEFLESDGKSCKHMGQQVRKAQRIFGLSGRFTDSLKEQYIDFAIGGDKTTNFFHNIWKPEDNSYATIDVHMCQLMTGNMECKVVKHNNYKFLKDILIEYAQEHQMNTSVMQAMIWTTWKKIKPRYSEKTNISYNLAV